MQVRYLALDVYVLHEALTKAQCLDQHARPSGAASQGPFTEPVNGLACDQNGGVLWLPTGTCEAQGCL